MTREEMIALANQATQAAKEIHQCIGYLESQRDEVTK